MYVVFISTCMQILTEVPHYVVCLFITSTLFNCLFVSVFTGICLFVCRWVLAYRDAQSIRFSRYFVCLQVGAGLQRCPVFQMFVYFFVCLFVGGCWPTEMPSLSDSVIISCVLYQRPPQLQLVSVQVIQTSKYCLSLQKHTANLLHNNLDELTVN